MRLHFPQCWYVAVMALMLVSCDNKKEDPANTFEPKAMADTAYKRYAVKQAHIHYENSGHMRGHEDLYFTNWGLREARHTNVELLQPDGVRPQQMVVITDGSMMTMVDLAAKTGSKFREPFVDSLIQLENPDPPESTSVRIMTDMRYESLGTDTVLGKTTNVWFDPRSGTTIWLWGGVMLKQKVDNPMQKHQVLAVSIDTVTPIDPSKFAAPQNVKYTEGKPRLPGRK